MRPVYGKRGSDRVRAEVERKFVFPIFVSRLMGNSDFDLESERVRERSKMRPVYEKCGLHLNAYADLKQPT